MKHPSRDGRADPLLVKRFLKAARLASSLEGSGIGRIVEVSAEGAEPYVATEFIHGIDLQQLGLVTRASPDGCLVPALAAHLGAQIAEALAFAHTAPEPVLHGALGPGNVMVTARGEVKLLDFGLGAAVRQLHSGDVDQWQYVAPEVRAGDPGDARSDLYSLGVLIHELCAGRSPVAETTLGEFKREGGVALRPSRAVPESLAAALGRLLASDPAQRPESARQAADELARGSAEMDPGEAQRALVALVRRARKDAASGEPERGTELALSGDSLGSDEPRVEAELELPPDVVQMEEAEEIDLLSMPPIEPPAVPPATPPPVPESTLEPIAMDDSFLDEVAAPSRFRWRPVAVIGVAVLGVGLALKLVVFRQPESPVVATAVRSLPAAPIPAKPAAVAPVAAPAAVVPVAAPAAVVPVAAPAAVAPVAAPAVPGRLVVTTTPPGAAVWLDGTDRGRTPMTVELEAGKHRIALILPGFELVKDTVASDSGAEFKRSLTPVASPSAGQAGIKVRCKTEGRFPVFVDGKPTGFVCPTERINVAPGEHEVAIYDPADDSMTGETRRFEVSNSSTRVRFPR